MKSNYSNLLLFLLLLFTLFPHGFSQEEGQQQPEIKQQARPYSSLEWFRDDTPPPASVINQLSSNARSFAAPQQRFYPSETPSQNPQFVDRKQQYRPPSPPVWNANPQYAGTSGPEPPPGQFSSWLPSQFSSYQAPSQRPEEVAYSQQGSQQPQLSFRSPSGQFSPVSSSSQFSLPSALQGIAYYLPNQPSATPNYGSEYTLSSGAASDGNKRPPVLLIGNFPSRQGGSGGSPLAATFPYIPTTTLPFVTKYSPPNGLTAGPYTTRAAPGHEEYGSSPSLFNPGEGSEISYETPKPSPPAPSSRPPPRPIPLPSPSPFSEEEAPPSIPKANVFNLPPKPGRPKEEQPGYENVPLGGPTSLPTQPPPAQPHIPGQPLSPGQPQGHPPSLEMPCQPPRLPGQPRLPVATGQIICPQSQPPQKPGQPQNPSQPPQQHNQPLPHGQPKQQEQAPPPQIPRQPLNEHKQPQQPGQPPSSPQFSGQPIIPGRPERPGQPPQFLGQPKIPEQPQVPGQRHQPSGFGQTTRFPEQASQTPGQPPSPEQQPQLPRFPAQPVPSPQFPTLVPPRQNPPFRPGLPSPPRPEFTPPPFILGRSFSPSQPGQPTASPPQSSQPSPPPAPPLRSIQPPMFTPPPEVQPKSNRMRGKARVICEETGIEFGINTVFPFTGQIFAHDRKRIPNCVHTFNQAWNINVSFSYAECGIKNSGNESSQQAQFHLQIIVMFEQANNTTSIQSFISQCGQQKVSYNKQTIPKRIEEALEELKFVPTKLEQKAPIPQAEMHVVTDMEHHKHGDGMEVMEVKVGEPLRIEFSLQPESEAYGFHVRDCVVKDMVSGAEHQVIDEKGCSTDLNIFAHPHYDTYHDVARVHWHAFKLPDHTQLSVRCHLEICTEINDENGMNSCADIPTPPFCPDLITSPSNSILSDVNSNQVRRYAKRQTLSSPMVQDVHADICFSKKKTSSNQQREDYCSTEDFYKDRQKHLYKLQTEDVFSTRLCASRPWISLITSFCASVLVLAALLNLCAIILGRRRGSWSIRSEEDTLRSKKANAKGFPFVSAVLSNASY